MWVPRTPSMAVSWTLTSAPDTASIRRWPPRFLYRAFWGVLQLIRLSGRGELPRSRNRLGTHGRDLRVRRVPHSVGGHSRVSEEPERAGPSTSQFHLLGEPGESSALCEGAKHVVRDVVCVGGVTPAGAWRYLEPAAAQTDLTTTRSRQ